MGQACSGDFWGWSTWFRGRLRLRSGEEAWVLQVAWIFFWIFLLDCSMSSWGIDRADIRSGCRFWEIAAGQMQGVDVSEGPHRVYEKDQVEENVPNFYSNPLPNMDAFPESQPSPPTIPSDPSPSEKSLPRIIFALISHKVCRDFVFFFCRVCDLSTFSQYSPRISCYILSLPVSVPTFTEIRGVGVPQRGCKHCRRGGGREGGGLDRGRLGRGNIERRH